MVLRFVSFTPFLFLDRGKPVSVHCLEVIGAVTLWKTLSFGTRGVRCSFICVSNRNTIFDGHAWPNQNGSHFLVKTGAPDPSGYHVSRKFLTQTNKKSKIFSKIFLICLPKTSTNISMCGRPETHMCWPCCQALCQVGLHMWSCIGVISIHWTSSCNLSVLYFSGERHRAQCFMYAAVNQVSLNPAHNGRVWQR